MTLALLLLSIAYIFWLLSRNRILTLALERAHEKERRLVLESRKAQDELKKYEPDSPFRAAAPIEPEVVEEIPRRPAPFGSDRMDLMAGLMVMAGSALVHALANDAISKSNESKMKLSKYKKILKTKTEAAQK